MTIYKSSSNFENAGTFGGIVFDCDGVLIDSSGSYDRTLVFCSRAFASVLGLDFEDEDLSNTIGEIRKLGTFNNDWDTQAVIFTFLYSNSDDAADLEKLTRIQSLKDQLGYFESLVLREDRNDSTKKRINFGNLRRIVSKLQEGTDRHLLCSEILGDESLARDLADLISYPKPVGQGFLATLFDEIVYGKSVFRDMYGFECATRNLSDPGLILNEKRLVSESSLLSFFSSSDGNLGIITGRPRIPTLFTLGMSFQKWFRRPELCLFTGDYILSVDEVKPSPKPMFKVANNLTAGPILYVGDSGEDVLMTKRANLAGELSKKVYFAGVASSKEKAKYFTSEEQYVDCIVSDVNELASLIEKNLSSNKKNVHSGVEV